GGDGGRGQRCVPEGGGGSAEGDPRGVGGAARERRLHGPPGERDRRPALHVRHRGAHGEGPRLVRQRVGLLEPLRGSREVRGRPAVRGRRGRGGTRPIDPGRRLGPRWRRRRGPRRTGWHANGGVAGSGWSCCARIEPCPRRTTSITERTAVRSAAVATSPWWSYGPFASRSFAATVRRHSTSLFADWTPFAYPSRSRKRTSDSRSRCRS